MRSWIYEAGSLTARLRAGCGAEFGVTVLRQWWERPFRGEIQALGLRGHRRALVREVLLHRAGTPLILARSIIPPEALKGVQCRLANLGNRPLGELLFSYPKLRRENLNLARIEPELWRLPLLAEGGVTIKSTVWGRRSRYVVASGHVLVCEFFLPDVLDL